jgi:GntR family transcriptional regulator, transcriptional repressor for pyruvate dehydrogenase complex
MPSDRGSGSRRALPSAGHPDRPVPAPAKPKGAQRIADTLRFRIMDGKLRDGELLEPEAVLLADFGVSRSVLREAMRILESESFLTVRRGVGGGARVRLPNRAVAARYTALVLQARGCTGRDLRLALEAIEPEIIREFALHPPERGLHRLRAALDEESLLVGESGSAGLAANFHRELIESSGIRVAGTLLSMLDAIIQRHLWLSSQVSDTTSADQAAHGRIVALIEAGDAAGAERLWRRHLRRGRCAAMTLVRDDGPLDLFGYASGTVRWGQSAGVTPGSIPKGSEIVAADLRRLILDGTLAEGDQVPTEARLMTQYGFGRATVREALRILESEQLVRLVRGSHHGGRVQAPNLLVAARQMAILLQLEQVQLRELVYARMLLEIGAVSILAARPHRATLDELTRIFDEELTAGSDVPRQTHLEVSFHTALVRGARNVTFETLFALISILFDSAVREAYVDAKTEWSLGSQGDVRDSHGTLLSCLRAKDVDGARAVWREHLRRELNGVWETLGETPLTAKSGAYKLLPPSQS